MFRTHSLVAEPVANGVERHRSDEAMDVLVVPTVSSTRSPHPQAKPFLASAKPATNAYEATGQAVFSHSPAVFSHQREGESCSVSSQPADVDHLPVSRRRQRGSTA